MERHEGFASKEQQDLTDRDYSIYLEDFRLREGDLVGKTILDIGGGLSEFVEVVNSKFKHLSTSAYAADPMYAFLDHDLDIFEKNLRNANLGKPLHVDNAVAYPADKAPLEARLKRIIGQKEAGWYIAASHQELPFPTDEFDLVLSNNSIFIFKDLGTVERALREVIRVMKPGGEARFSGFFTESAKRNQPYVALRAYSHFGSVLKEIETIGARFYLLRKALGPYPLRDNPNLFLGDVLVIRRDGALPDLSFRSESEKLLKLDPSNRLKEGWRYYIRTEVVRPPPFGDGQAA